MAFRFPSLLLAFALAVLPVTCTRAAPGDDGPPISITSPDTGTTYALATIKNRSISWNKRDHVLIVNVTFVELDSDSNNQFLDDTHEFRLPGVSLDEAKGLFYATSAKGEQIPVAHFKKVLFMKTIETTPNAVVRIIHPKGGDVTVILEAISPNDPAMHSSDVGPDAPHSVDLPKLFN